MIDGRIPIHWCWVQGAEVLPETFRKNLAAWRAILPEDFVLVGWDHRSGSAAFPFYAEHADRMSHPAMRADLILLHAQVHLGGLVIGTDMRPNRGAPLFERMRRGSGFLVKDRRGHFYNGMSYAPRPWEPPFAEILQQILMAPERFTEPYVPGATGPMRWTSILGGMDHGLDVLSETDVWTRSYWESAGARPDAWVDPGFAASHDESLNPRP
ncbi:hypothetical protein [Luteolibacter sp. LG18]|uniref:hypothetical protein n=1 Tax=Luteolibacter sp. LG18 TaxID=2819286 RepID=UPI002B2BD6DD|nr:hypothetical protein llg_23740 [Luteolibacter sp. LG18]